MIIQPSTLSFLSDLKQNNTREWFEANRDRYEAARENFLQFVSALIEILGQWEEGIKKQSPKDMIFRIYRDVRFSKNKDPYKTHFGAWFNSRGKQSQSAGYYFHLEPGNTFLAGGVYMPPAEELKSIRQEIDYNFEDFKNLLEAKEFKEYFGNLSGDKLKSAPKDYPKDHQAIEWLRHKDFIMEHQLKDEEVTSGNLLKKAEKVFSAMRPLNSFMNEALGLADEKSDV